MKKIININLSGRVIPIEDAAYEKLQAYIESLRRYFAKEESRDEIINDIESRIAELMNEKVRKGATAVTEEDIEEIISSMGRVEDFEAADKEEETTASSAKQTTGSSEYAYTKKERGRLYRDTSDKFIGGVCSGLAAYMNVDPAIVRILFAIVTFGGFGLGFLIYIILWAILPPKDMEGFTGKKLYRNPDDKMIGGVAGGLGAYFGKRTSTIRLIFAAPIILSTLVGIIKGVTWDYDIDWAFNIGFGSLSGTFIFVYIILWIVLPEAVSDYQKMEMRGETVDVNRIRQNVKEGVDNMKERMKGWSNEVKESAQSFSAKAKEFSNTKGKAFANEVNETFSRGGRGIGHAIGVLFKAFFLFIFGTIAFSIFVGLIALIFGGIAWGPINNFLWTSNWQQVYAWGTLIFFFLVPLVAFMTWLIRRIARVKSRNNYLGWIFGGLWTIGWVFMSLFASSVGKDFRYQRSADTNVEIKQPINNKLILSVSQPELEFTGGFGWIDEDSYGWNLTSDTISLSSVDFDVKASADSLYHVTVKRYSFGRSNEDALNRASKINYEVYPKDSLLDLANGYMIDKDSKFRGQHVIIEILVPMGKKIRFDRSVREKLNAVRVKVKRSSRRNRITGIIINDDDYHFRYRSDVDYTMGQGGELKADDEPVAPAVNNTTNDYRYNDGNPEKQKDNNDDIKRQLEEEKRKQEQLDKEKEESRRKQKELEDKIKSSKPNGKKKDKIGTSSETYAGGPSPVTSLVEWF
jgi:phage shock protein PspC (stress-responsive transcriptional regulator)